MTPPFLLAVPNVSEGRDPETIAKIGRAFAGGDDGARAPGGVRLLDVHSDRDHHRSVFTLGARQGELADSLLRGAKVAVERVDVMHEPAGEGSGSRQHPYVGAVDVVPLVYLDEETRGAACAEALVVADRIGEELGVPVFLYGELTGRDGKPGRTRAELRRGGAAALSAWMARRGTAEEPRLRPDFGPAEVHPSAGATLLAARSPLVAFNLQLAAPARIDDARAVAALIREGGAEGLPGVRAIGVELGGAPKPRAGSARSSNTSKAPGNAAGGEIVAQVSVNVERPLQTPLVEVLEAVRRHAPLASAELVGLAPRAALEGFPEDVSLIGFDPARHVIENALGF